MILTSGLSETGSFPQHGRAVPSRFPSSLPSNSVSPINLSTSNTGIPSAGEPLKPRFKAFDQYLKERAYNTVDLPLNQSYLPRELIRGQPNIVSLHLIFLYEVISFSYHVPPFFFNY